MKLKYYKYGFLISAVIVIIALCAFSKTTPKEDITPNDVNGISFIEQDWSKALAQAKTQNKLVFLDIYATWCGPCKLLKKNTFSNAQVGEFFNKNFVNVSVDGEQGVGPDLAQQFAIEGYPTLIVTDKTGKLLLYSVGYMNANDLMLFAKEALKKK